MTPTIIHRSKRLSGKPAGTVERDGRVLGRAQLASRVAAGTGGNRRRFYTALAHFDGLGHAGPSLGTRHPTRASAVRAIRAFAAEYPPARIEALTAYALPRLHPWQTTNRDYWAYLSAACTATAKFKRDNPDLCALRG